MENLGFHSFTQMKNDYTTNSHYLFTVKKKGEAWWHRKRMNPFTSVCATLDKAFHICADVTRTMTSHVTPRGMLGRNTFTTFWWYFKMLGDVTPIWRRHVSSQTTSGIAYVRFERLMGMSRYDTEGRLRDVWVRHAEALGIMERQEYRETSEKNRLFSVQWTANSRIEASTF